MGLFETMVQNMQNMEFFQYLFPFLLAFAVLYGVLTWVFKDKLNTRVSGLISLVFAFFVMLYSASNPWLYQFLTDMSGIWLSIASLIIFVVVLLALAGINIHDLLGGEKNWVKWLVVIIILYVVISMLLGYGSWVYGLPWLTGSEFLTLIFFVFILALVFWWTSGEGGNGGDAGAGGGAPPPQ